MYFMCSRRSAAVGCAGQEFGNLEATTQYSQGLLQFSAPIFAQDEYIDGD